LCAGELQPVGKPGLGLSGELNDLQFHDRRGL
jgi:hypothetical protein